MDLSNLDSVTLTLAKRGPLYPTGVLVTLQNAKASAGVTDLNALWNDLRAAILADPAVVSMTAGFVVPSGAPLEDVTLAISKKMLNATLKFTPTAATLAANPAPAAIPTGVRPPPVTPKGTAAAAVPSVFPAPPPFVPSATVTAAPVAPVASSATPPPAKN